MSSKKYLYIFTRKDLSPSQIAVQSVHSAFEMGRYCFHEENHPSVVLLRAKNEEDLLKCKDYVETMGLKFKEFKEPYYNDSLTSFTLEPIIEEQRILLKKFKLMQDTDFLIK